VKNYREPIEQKIIKSILRGLWWLLSAPFKLIFGKRNPGQMQRPENVNLDRQFVSTKWQEIEQLMALGQPSNFQRAVLEADKLLDHLLKGHRTPGLTMGDRLKASKNKFSQDGYNAAWSGHKVRNEIVHNAEFPVTDFVARKAIQNFQKAVGELI
jgi:hypothetical protein